MAVYIFKRLIMHSIQSLHVSINGNGDNIFDWNLNDRKCDECDNCSFPVFRGLKHGITPQDVDK